MKVQNVNFYNNYKPIQNIAFKKAFFLKKPASLQNEKYKPLSEQEIKAQLVIEDKYFRNFLHKKGKLTDEEYREITSKHPYTLTKCSVMCDREEYINLTPRKIAQLAISLKEYYDKLYGNYTVLSVGTSPAIFCEVMKHLGSKVIFMPISGVSPGLETNKLHPLRDIYPQTLTSRYDNLKLLMKYCTKEGINNKDAGEIVILDFAQSGTTLDIVEKLIQERGDIEKDKIHKHSIIKDFKRIAQGDNLGRITISEAMRAEEDLIFSYFENCTNVPHFYINKEFCGNENTVDSSSGNAHTIFRQFDEFSTPRGRAWELCSMYEAFRFLNNIS